MVTQKRDDFARRIEGSVRRLIEGRRERESFWRYAALIGVGGWLFALPVVAGAYLGRFLDARGTGGASWTVTMILVGIACGSYNLWYFLFRRKGE